MTLAVCESAEDVRRLARRQAEWRRKQFDLQQRVAELEHVVEKMTTPPPAPVVQAEIDPCPEFISRPPTTATRIIDLACVRFNLTLAMMLSNRRQREIVRPRQIAMWLCHVHTRLSLPQIGRKFGGRDHTTVLHAIRKIDELRQVDANITAAIAELESELTP